MAHGSSISFCLISDARWVLHAELQGRLSDVERTKRGQPGTCTAIFRHSRIHLASRAPVQGSTAVNEDDSVGHDCLHERSTKSHGNSLMWTEQIQNDLHIDHKFMLLARKSLAPPATCRCVR